MSARGKTKKQLPPANGKLVRKQATCSRCGNKCKIGGQLIDTDAHYTYNDETVCKVCIKKLGVL